MSLLDFGSIFRNVFLDIAWVIEKIRLRGLQFFYGLNLIEFFSYNRKLHTASLFIMSRTHIRIFYATNSFNSLCFLFIRNN